MDQWVAPSPGAIIDGMRYRRAIEKLRVLGEACTSSTRLPLDEPFLREAYVFGEVLLLYADHDVRAPVSIGEAVHGAMPSSELVVQTGPGHVSTVEAPDDITRELRRFLRSAERG